MTNEQLDELAMYDNRIDSVDWLKQADLPTALVLTETLMPAEGAEAIIFPPTFAKTGGKHPYSIDEFWAGDPQKAARDGLEVNTCLIDSVASQANRMEEMFLESTIFPDSKLPALVPQVTITAGDQKVNLLSAGHRIADAAVRFSDKLNDKANDAILAMERGDASVLARLAPTSIVFGFWDSRETQFKAGRLLSSTIRATNVAVVSRAGVYQPAFDASALGLAKPELVQDVAEEREGSTKTEKEMRDALAEQGLVHIPIPATTSKPVVRVDGKVIGIHGGVRVFGRIVRRTQVSLVGVRALAALDAQNKLDPEQTIRLRRYVLGLALIAARCQRHYSLREGCSLVLSPDIAVKSEEVYPKGNREPFNWDLQEVLSYAQAAKEEFGKQKPEGFSFNKSKAGDALKKKNK